MELDLWHNTVPTFWVRLFMAGDLAVATQVCREECYREGLCVTIRPCRYVYTGGEEDGFEVGLLNYPRFPSDRPTIRRRAEEIGKLLLVRCCQRSFLVVTPDETTWFHAEPPGSSTKEGKS